MRTRTVYSRTLIMKKILSALMLAAGMSLSATAATTLLDSSIVGYSDFTSRLAGFRHPEGFRCHHDRWRQSGVVRHDL